MKTRKDAVDKGGEKNDSMVRKEESDKNTGSYKKFIQQFGRLDREEGNGTGEEAGGIVK